MEYRLNAVIMTDKRNDKGFLTYSHKITLSDNNSIEQRETALLYYVREHLASSLETYFKWRFDKITLDSHSDDSVLACITGFNRVNGKLIPQFSAWIERDEPTELDVLPESWRQADGIRKRFTDSGIHFTADFSTHSVNSSDYMSTLLYTR